jgi:hypothetical protein
MYTLKRAYQLKMIFHYRHHVWNIIELEQYQWKNSGKFRRIYSWCTEEKILLAHTLQRPEEVI